ncbi:MAG: SDR family oxidoreductase [Cyanobacteria bacterium J06621_12]
MKRLQDRITLVTGSSSGIGAAVAKCMAAEGAKVIVNYARSAKGAETTVAEIEADGGQAIAIQADVSQEDQVKSMFQQIFDKYGTIDVLVSNAGLQQDANLVDMTLDQWNKVISVNLTGQFLCAREAAQEFIRRGVVPEKSCVAGNIICMSSVHEVIPWAGHCNYAASKGGVMLLMKSMAQELAPYKIRVNSIAPGAIKTPINSDAWDTPEAEAELLKLIPYNRVGIPKDIGKAAVWLASDESEYIQGSTIFVDGGMTLYPGFATGG